MYDGASITYRDVFVNTFSDILWQNKPAEAGWGFFTLGGQRQDHEQQEYVVEGAVAAAVGQFGGMDLDVRG